MSKLNPGSGNSRPGDSSNTLQSGQSDSNSTKPSLKERMAMKISQKDKGLTSNSTIFIPGNTSNGGNQQSQTKEQGFNIGSFAGGTGNNFQMGNMNMLQNALQMKPPPHLPGNNTLSQMLNPALMFSKTMSKNMSKDSTESDPEYDQIIRSIINLRDPATRYEALDELNKKREVFTDLAPMLWWSFGTIAILLQEIVSIYPYLSPPQLNNASSNRVCNVLGLLQCLALHSEIRSLFLEAYIPLFLYPYLHTSNKTKPFENLRVTSLGVIGALVKGDDSNAIQFLMQTEIIPMCLRIMKKGMDLSRTVATFIIQKILLDDNGLIYICESVEKFYAIITVLQVMVSELIESGKIDQRLLRHIVKCYLRLSENPRANESMRKFTLPILFGNDSKDLISDEIVKKWHTQLLKNLGFLPPDSNEDEQERI